jgi:hypothetical protein
MMTTTMMTTWMLMMMVMVVVYSLHTLSESCLLNVTLYHCSLIFPVTTNGQSSTYQKIVNSVRFLYCCDEENGVDRGQLMPVL